jgi:hypothetical protein
MKKLSILLLVLMMAVFSVNAAETGNTATTTTKTFNEKGGDTLTIKAYKKKKTGGQDFTIKVIDALTGSLDDIFERNNTDIKVINIDNYVDKFLGSTSDTTGLRKKAIFSIHAGGNIKGDVTVKVTFSPLTLYTLKTESDTEGTFLTIKDENGNNVTYKKGDKVIKVKYFMQDINYYFTSAGASVATDSSSQTEKIELTGNTTGNVEVTDKSENNYLSFSWKVTPGDSSSLATENYWDVEAMFAMIIDSTTYNDNKTDGTYIAPITISITYGS